MATKKREVKIGQICWLTGGMCEPSLNFRLVKVVKLMPRDRVFKIGVKLLNPREGDTIDENTIIGVFNANWLLIYPEEYHKYCEGTPDSITQPTKAKSNVCMQCNNKLTVKAKFCPECGTKVDN